MNRLLRVLLLILTLAFGAGAADVYGQGIDYYWVNGDGNWIDVSHWATSSGNANGVLHTQPPTGEDNVFFDQNSSDVVTPESFTVTISSAPAACKNMSWAGAVNPTLDGIGSLTITGSLTLIEDMEIDFTGSIIFATNDENRELTFAGQELLGPVQFNGNGSWLLKDKLGVIKDIIIEKGTVKGSNQNIEISGRWIIEPGAKYISGTGTVTMKGGDSREIKTNSDSPFYNLVINKQGGNVLLVTPIQVNNNLDIQNGVMRDEGYQINNLGAGIGKITIADGASLLLGDDNTIGATTFPIFSNAPDLGNTSTVNYRDRATSQTIAGINYGNLILSNGPTTGSTLNSKVLGAPTTVRGNLTVGAGINFSDNGNQINASPATGNTLTLSPAVINSNPPLNAVLTLGNGGSATLFPNFTTMNLDATSTVVYNAGVNQTIRGLSGAGNASYGNLVLTNPTTTSRAKELNNNVNIRGNLTINANNTLDVSSSNHNISIQGNWFIAQPTANNNNNIGTFNARAGSVTFNGSANQAINFPFTSATVTSGNGNNRETTTNYSNPFSFYNLVIDNSTTGSGQGVILNTPVSVSNNVNFTSGDVVATLEKIFIFLSNATHNIPQNQIKDNSHVNGPVQKIGTGYFTFPIGNGTVYRPAGVDMGGSSQTIRMQYFASDAGTTFDPKTNKNRSRTRFESANNGTLFGLGGPPSAYEHWVATNGSGENASPKIDLTWRVESNGNNNSGPANYIGVNNPDWLVVAAWTADRWTDNTDGEWANRGGTTRGGGARNTVYIPQQYGLVDGTEAISGVITYFTIGRVFEALPIELLYFRAQLQEKAVQFKWATAKEINNDYFTVEKSADGQSFTELLQVKGAGNSQEMRQYTAQDASPYVGVTYYRLKQTDKDGKFSYSKIEAVHSGKDGSLLQVYQPASGQLQVNYQLPAEANGMLRIYDSRGVQVWGKQVSANAAAGQELIPMGAARGLYLVSLQTNGGTTIKRIVVY